MNLVLSLKGNWNAVQGKLKQRYAQLTDDDLIYREGREDELVGRLQKRAGAPSEELEKIFRQADEL